MWQILDYNSHSPVSLDKSRGLFHDSLSPAIGGKNDETGDTTVEDFGTPATVIYSTTAEDYAQPVDWFDAVATPNRGGDNPTASRSLEDTANARTEHGTNIEQDWSIESMPLVGNDTLFELGPQSFMDMCYQNGEMPLWWESASL